MRRRHVILAASAAALLVAGLAAGCGSQGVAEPTPEHVQGTVTAPTTPTTAKGDPVKGKAVFAGNGCAGCHTYTPAGATQTIGPDLDKLADYAKQAKQPLVDFTQSAITSPPPAYVPPPYNSPSKLVMPKTYGQSLNAQDLANLVAFLTQKP